MTSHPLIGLSCQALVILPRPVGSTTPASRGRSLQPSRAGVPFLGICVGMQWLLTGSSEAPDQPGLGHFHGRCDRFPEGAEKVPHVGWNQILPRTEPSTQLFGRC